MNDDGYLDYLEDRCLDSTLDYDPSWYETDEIATYAYPWWWPTNEIRRKK